MLLYGNWSITGWPLLLEFLEFLENSLKVKCTPWIPGKVGHFRENSFNTPGTFFLSQSLIFFPCKVSSPSHLRTVPWSHKVSKGRRSSLLSHLTPWHSCNIKWWKRVENPPHKASLPPDIAVISNGGYGSKILPMKHPCLLSPHHCTFLLWQLVKHYFL